MRKTKLFHLEANDVKKIISHSAWKCPQQDVSSLSTNTCMTSNLEIAKADNTEGIGAFMDINFEDDTKKILDIGGGQFDTNTEYMKKRGYQLLVWDPYARSETHNLAVQEKCELNPVDAVTSMSVLNVIPNVQARIAHIATAFHALKNQGEAYFKIWPGQGEFRGSRRSYENKHEDKYQANAFAKAYVYEIIVVFGAQNVRIVSDKQLIVATKNLEYCPTLYDIQKLITLCQLETLIFQSQQSHQNIYKFFKIKKCSDSVNKTRYLGLEHVRRSP